MSIHKAARFFYIGSFSPDAGITLARRTSAGPLEPVAAFGGPTPSFLARHPDVGRLYAVDTSGATIDTYRVAPDGALELARSDPSYGDEPCHLAVNDRADRLAVANYGDGTVCVYALDAVGDPCGEPFTIALSASSIHPQRQLGSHAHMCAFEPDGRLMCVDLGGDRVTWHDPGEDYRVVDVLTLPPGTGPRHVIRGYDATLYVAGEIDASVSCWMRGASGWRQTARLPASAQPEPNLPSHLQLDPARPLLYVANRGPDTLSVFSVGGGRLERRAECTLGGRWPRHFSAGAQLIDVALEHSGRVATFAVRSEGIVEVGTTHVIQASCVLPWRPVPDSARRPPC